MVENAENGRFMGKNAENGRLVRKMAEIPENEDFPDFHTVYPILTDFLDFHTV